MAFNRNFPSNGRRFNGNSNRGNSGGGGRGSFKGGRSFRDNGNSKNEQNYELRGIAWGNRFLEEQKEGAPVLQGYATVNGVKYRLAGFLNVGPNFKEDRAAQKEKLAIAREINNILLDGQEQFGLAFSLTFEEPEEEGQGGGGGGSRRSSGASPSRRNRNEEPEEEEEEEIPFNKKRGRVAEEEEEEAEEPVDEEEEEEEEAPKPARARRTEAPAKVAKPAAKGKSTAKAVKKGR